MQVFNKDFRRKIYIGLAVLALSPLLLTFFSMAFYEYYDCYDTDNFPEGCAQSHRFFVNAFAYLPYSMLLAAVLSGAYSLLKRFYKGSQP